MASAPKPAPKSKPVPKPKARAKRSAEPTIVNVHAAKTQLSRLLARVERGEVITIAKHNRPVARLSPIQPPRRLGMDRGKVWISDDFNDPDPELEALFYDGPIFPD